MKRIKKFLIYFPVILVSLQVAVNFLALIDRPTYDAFGFYLSLFVGTNIFFAAFLVTFTFAFNFCLVSRASAIAELLFGLNYLIVQEDSLYNILFQIITGIIALYITYRYFVRKFPLCSIGLFHSFIRSVFEAKDCKKGLDKWENEVKIKMSQLHAIPRNVR